MRPLERIRRFVLSRGRRRTAKRAKTVQEASAYERWRTRERRKREDRMRLAHSYDELKASDRRQVEEGQQ